MSAEAMLKAVVAREGGYVNDPRDRGGETNHGITVAVARAFGYYGAMKDMTPDIAFRIYRERFWLQPGLDKVEAISADLAEELLDTGVNMAPVWAGRFLQRALNSLNQQAKDFPDLTVDGQIGKLTIYCLHVYGALRGSAGLAVLQQMCNSQQSVRYIELAENNATQEDFEYGWQRLRAMPLVRN